MALRTYDYYVDVYGGNGWKGPGDTAIAAMLRDELANPGLTELSQFPRHGLVQAGLWFDPIRPQHSGTSVGATGMVMLTTDFTKMPPTSMTGTEPIAVLNAEADLRYKQMPITFMHGAENNPFVKFYHTMDVSGNVTLDATGTLDVDWLTTYYQNWRAGIPITGLDYDFMASSTVITSRAILVNFLDQVVENHIGSATEVLQLFGNRVENAAGEAVTHVTYVDRLPAWSALSDPKADLAIKGYLAYFGRAPDPVGLTNWVTTLNNSNSTMDALVENFGNSTESNALYSSASSAARVTAIFQYLFNRAPRQAGLDFWSDAIDSGQMTMAGAALNILNGARDDGAASIYDLTIVNEKVEAARAFVAALDTQHEVDQYRGATAALASRKLLSAINADDAHNNQVVSILGQVVDTLNGNVDAIFAANNITLGYY